MTRQKTKEPVSEQRKNKEGTKNKMNKIQELELILKYYHGRSVYDSHIQTRIGSLHPELDKKQPRHILLKTLKSELEAGRVLERSSTFK